MKKRTKPYCSRCKREDVPLHKYANKGTRQYYYCRECETARMRKYVQTERGRERVNAAVRKSTAKHWDKALSRARMHYHLKQGHIQKPTVCSACNTSGVPIQAHHEDYSQPLNVRWLCRGCHAEVHK